MQAWVKRAYDPRAVPEARLYQTLEYQLPPTWCAGDMCCILVRGHCLFSPAGGVRNLMFEARVKVRFMVGKPVFEAVPLPFCRWAGISQLKPPPTSAAAAGGPAACLPPTALRYSQLAR
jgi:hypothetical protein